MTCFIEYTCTYSWNLQFLNHVIITKTKVLLPQRQVTITDNGYSIYALWFSFSHHLFSNILDSNVPYDGYSKNVSCVLSLIYTFIAAHVKSM